MEGHLIAVLVGSTIGMIAGLLPGLGILASSLIAFPFISGWTPINVFLFYASLTQISQFCGSVTTIYTGVAGEASSMPTVNELKRLPLALVALLLR
jgi:putative tricarboxylic transport membrane protein